MRTKRFLLALLALFLAMASLALIESVRLFHLFQAQNASDRPGAQLERMEKYVQTHNRVRPGRVLTFEWDEAYIDRAPFGTGEAVRALTVYEFALRPLNDARWQRLLFFKDGQLVSEMVCDGTRWIFPEELDGFKADIMFYVQAGGEKGAYTFAVAKGCEDAAIRHSAKEKAPPVSGAA